MFDIPVKFYVRKKIFWVSSIFIVALLLLFGRIVFLVTVKGDYYSEKATQVHERERRIKARRGKIYDRNGEILADNKVVCSISVIHNQVVDAENTIKQLSEILEIDEAVVRKRVEKKSSIEIIKTNVPEEIGRKIEKLSLPGVKVDSDFKRFYPDNELASKVLGFVGSDNQGIIGLEVIYDDYLTGEDGIIYTNTDAAGVEVKDMKERLLNSIPGKDLYISLDRTIQSYSQQLAEMAYLKKSAEEVLLLVMNPQNGEILACVNYPEFDLNAPYQIIDELSEDYEQEVLLLEQNGVSMGNAVGGSSISVDNATGDMRMEALKNEVKQKYLNRMWRNSCINDTYEPGSTFKIITATAALEEKVVDCDSSFFCPGYIIVDDRRIRCHKTTGHGSEDFVKATMNSCNPVFITLGLRLGVDRFLQYFDKLGLLEKTGVDLPGEAKTIMHKPDNMGNVELATVAFGQSFQLSPIRLLTTVSYIINGGKKIVPHFGKGVFDESTGEYTSFDYSSETIDLSEETCEKMKMILEKVVSEGSGKNGSVQGFSVGGKTATSQMLPRSSHTYISSFIGFSPADNPQVIAIAIVKKPKGIYYGSQVAAPIVRQLFENILPYLEKKEYNQ